MTTMSLYFHSTVTFTIGFLISTGLITLHILYYFKLLYTKQLVRGGKKKSQKWNQLRLYQAMQSTIAVEDENVFLKNAWPSPSFSVERIHPT